MSLARPSPHIELLPPTTQSRLRSAQILTSLPQIISELVQNSLDAGACQVDIGVDCEDWGCWVRDDGAGISRDGLAVIAGDFKDGGGRYATSKAYTPASLDEVTTFGFRGEALASAADLSCLEISSRTARSRESLSVILKGGATLYSGISTRWRRESPGTVVCVRDAFYNLPIRRLSHPSPTRTLELIKKDIEAFALVFPHVCFSLEDTRTAKEGGQAKGRVMTVPKTSSSLAAFRHLYGRALAEHVEEIKESSGEMKLRGFIGLEGAYSKSYQFLYINHHLLAPCDLHRAIDAKFSASSFMKHAYDESGETSLPRSTTRRSPRKTEKKPVYVLNISLPPRHVDNCLEPAKAAVQLQNSEAVSALLSSVVEVFLVRHGFAAPKAARVRSRPEVATPSPSPRKKRKIVQEGGRNNLLSEGTRELERSASMPTPAPSALRAVARSGSMPISAPLIVTQRADSDDETDGDAPRDIVWTDPTTGETFVVDTRTGNSYPRHVPPATGAEEDVSATRRRRTLRGGRNMGAVPAWIRDALAANEAYAPTEPRVRALALSASQHSCAPHKGKGCAADVGVGMWATGSFARDDLRGARVLGQADRKFIACVMGGAVVLVDQHAADERIRVERFLDALCHGFFAGGAGARALVPPVPVLVTRREAARLMESAEVRCAFERWGVGFVRLEEMEAGDEREYVQVMVSSVPEVVSDKLLTGDELRDLVKGFLARLEVEGTAALLNASMSDTRRSDGEAAECQFIWQKALRWCPKELLELVNSKACRGAIMFNDPLTQEQCERLVRELAETALPFQCAHGRPSLVPLAEVRGDGRSSRRCAVEWAEFGKHSG